MKSFFGKKIIFITVVTLVAMFAFVGCGKSDDNNVTGENANNTNNEELTGKVTIAGSTSVQPLSEELAVAFMDKNSGVRIEVAGGGSSAGVKAAQTETADIGAASRKLKDSETGVEGLVIARDGIAVVVHPENGVSDLTFEQIQQIFRGEITKWSEVGGTDSDIVVVNREEGSGTRGAFHEIVVGTDNEFVGSAIIQNSTGAVREAVSQDINAIGYISLGGMNDTVKAVKVNGIPATMEKILADEYPIARPFNYVLKEGKELSEAAQEYINFVMSAEGQKIVEESGFIPVK